MTLSANLYLSELLDTNMVLFTMQNKFNILVEKQHKINVSNLL